MAYLDHAATTNLLPEVKSLLVEQLGVAANPSSLHESGRKARQQVEEARERIAKVLQVRPSEIFFTAGGTESDNIAIKGLHWARQKDADRPIILISSVEHHAVLDPAQWLADRGDAVLQLIPVDVQGRIDLKWLAEKLAEVGSKVSLISVMWANNEVGTVQPIAEVVELAAQYEIPVHSDAVQALGTLPINLTEVPIAAFSASGHKIGALHGTGFLMLRTGIKVEQLQHGGNQERDVRSGTINAAGAQALALAVELAAARQPVYAKRVAELRNELVARVKAAVPDAIYNGDPANRLPGNAHFSFLGAEGDAMLMLLDAQGVQVSTGSACSVGIPQPSHVLIAMGLDPVSAKSSLRFSLGASSSTADIDELITALPDAVARARRAGMVSQTKVGSAT
jgi:cysteine desulfurase